MVTQTKRGFVILVLGIFVLSFLFMGLISAGLFNKNKITGNAVGEVSWQLEDSSGICLNSKKDINDLLESNSFLNNSCNFARSSQECNSLPDCMWTDGEWAEFMDKPIHVEKGWNLISGLLFPSQISEGDISPNNIKAGYLLDKSNQKYYQLYPEYDKSHEDFSAINYTSYIRNGVNEGGFILWIYFNKSGDFKFRGVPVLRTGSDSSEDGISDPLLVKGWNFIGINPAMFKDENGVSQDFFTLNEIRGNCNIQESYIFNSEEGGKWDFVNVVGGIISDDYLMRGLAIKVSDDCILGRSKLGFDCIMTEGPRRDVVGSVAIIKDGETIETKTDSCLSDEESETGQGYTTTYVCSYSKEGNVTIKAIKESCPTNPGFYVDSDPASAYCNNGLCIRPY
jgi:hypothetical protein